MNPVETNVSAALGLVAADPIVTELDDVIRGLPQLNELPLADAVTRMAEVHEQLQAALAHLDRT